MTPKLMDEIIVMKEIYIGEGILMQEVITTLLIHPKNLIVLKENEIYMLLIRNLKGFSLDILQVRI